MRLSAAGCLAAFFLRQVVAFPTANNSLEKGLLGNESLDTNSSGLKQNTSHEKIYPRKKLNHKLLGNLLSGLTGGVTGSGPAPAGGGPVTDLLGSLNNGPTGLFSTPRFNHNLPPQGEMPSGYPGDPPFTQGSGTYEAALVCPNGYSGFRSMVLMIPATGLRGDELWPRTPYLQSLSEQGIGGCMLNPPMNTVGDIQFAAEFVAHAVQRLFQASGQPVSVLTYSQGGLIFQWTITYFVSIRQMVALAVLLAPPLQGSSLAEVACSTSSVIGGCLPAVHQMQRTSNFIQALLSPHDPDNGASAKVPTVVLHTHYDEIVFPNLPVTAMVTSLQGSSSIAVQQVCGPAYVVDHYMMPSDMAVFRMAMKALVAQQAVAREEFDQSICQDLLGTTNNVVNGLTADLKATFRTLVGSPGQRVGMLLETLTTLTVPREPPLQEYVCSRNPTLQGQCVNGFSNTDPRQSLLNGLNLGNTLTSLLSLGGRPGN